MKNKPMAQAVKNLLLLVGMMFYKKDDLEKLLVM
jgi:hypothetical protein